jgi:predicted DNA-binding transcriptional regulator AlpA
METIDSTIKVILDDIIGRIEAEEILGVRPRTFSRLLAEGNLPAPVKTLGDGTRLWLRPEIEDFTKSRSA